MKRLIRRVYRKISKLLKPPQSYDFNKSNPLGGDGERVDIQLHKKLNKERMDMYQQNHFKRYEFACAQLQPWQTVGDFACGTGYGSVMMARVAKNVVGADIDTGVIKSITARYRNIPNVAFFNEDLMQLDYVDYFDVIVSFETLEHFQEASLETLLAFYYKALKPGGNLIISTPYLQEDSEAARKLGFHLTFEIDEAKIEKWLAKAGFEIESFYFQNYQSHEILADLGRKEFIICMARKK